MPAGGTRGRPDRQGGEEGRGRRGGEAGKEARKRGRKRSVKALWYSQTSVQLNITILTSTRSTRSPGRVDQRPMSSVRWRSSSGGGASSCSSPTSSPSLSPTAAAGAAAALRVEVPPPEADAASVRWEEKEGRERGWDEDREGERGEAGMERKKTRE